MVGRKKFWSNFFSDSKKFSAEKIFGRKKKVDRKKIRLKKNRSKKKLTEFFFDRFFLDRKFFGRTFSRVNYFSDLVCFQIKSQHLTPSSNGELSEWSQNSSFFHGKSWKIIKNHQNSPKSMIWGVRSGQKVDFFGSGQRDYFLFWDPKFGRRKSLDEDFSKLRRSWIKNWVSRHTYSLRTLT